MFSSAFAGGFEFGSCAGGEGLSVDAASGFGGTVDSGFAVVLFVACVGGTMGSAAAGGSDSGGAEFSPPFVAGGSALGGNGSIRPLGFVPAGSGFTGAGGGSDALDEGVDCAGSKALGGAGGFEGPVGVDVSIGATLMPRIRPFGRDRSSKTGSNCVVSTVDRFPARSRASIRTWNTGGTWGPGVQTYWPVFSMFSTIGSH